MLHGPDHLQSERKQAEQLCLGTARGERNADAACLLDDAAGDLPGHFNDAPIGGPRVAGCASEAAVRAISCGVHPATMSM